MSVSTTTNYKLKKPSDDEFYDVSRYRDNMDAIDAQMKANSTATDGKADKATTVTGYGITDAYTKTETDTLLKAKAETTNNVNATLSASSWSSGVYSFETTYPSSTYDLTVEPDGDKITDAQYKAWNGLKAVGSMSNKLIAKGKTPTVDIPVILKVVKKGA